LSIHHLHSLFTFLTHYSGVIEQRRTRLSSKRRERERVERDRIKERQREKDQRKASNNNDASTKGANDSDGAAAKAAAAASALAADIALSLSASSPFVHLIGESLDGQSICILSFLTRASSIAWRHLFVFFVFVRCFCRCRRHVCT
jgi:hypothetical protein